MHMKKMKNVSFYVHLISCARAQQMNYVYAEPTNNNGIYHGGRDSYMYRAIFVRDNNIIIEWRACAANACYILYYKCIEI